MEIIARIVTMKKGLLTSKNVVSWEWTGATTYWYISEAHEHYITIVTVLYERDTALTINLQEWGLTSELPPIILALQLRYHIF